MPRAPLGEPHPAAIGMADDPVRSSSLLRLASQALVQEKQMKVYAFDVDETLEISNGPVTLAMMEELRAQGHIVCISGNWGFFCRLPDWHLRISTILNLGTPKHYGMIQFRQYCPAEDYVLVGNIFGEKNSLGFVCGSHDSEEAALAGWRFIKEDDFANGVR